MFCTSVSVYDITFGHNGPYGVFQHRDGFDILHQCLVSFVFVLSVVLAAFHVCIHGFFGK